MQMFTNRPYQHQHLLVGTCLCGVCNETAALPSGFFCHGNFVIPAMLTERIKKAESGSPEDEKEIEELKGLLPEIKEKIEDSKESQKSARVAELALKATLVSVHPVFSFEPNVLLARLEVNQ